jgi:hypothetical protein
VSFSEIHSRFRELEAEVIRETDGRATFVDKARLVSSRLRDEFGDSAAFTLLEPLLLRSIRQAVSLRSIEKAEEDQGELFPESFLEATVKIDESTFCHVRDATWDVMVAANERSRKVLQRHIHKVEKMEERLRVLANLGMAENPAITVATALRAGRPAARSGVAAQTQIEALV